MCMCGTAYGVWRPDQYNMYRMCGWDPKWSWTSAEFEKRKGAMWVFKGEKYVGRVGLPKLQRKVQILEMSTDEYKVFSEKEDTIRTKMLMDKGVSREVQALRKFCAGTHTKIKYACTLAQTLAQDDKIVIYSAHETVLQALQSRMQCEHPHLGVVLFSTSVSDEAMELPVSWQ